MRLIEAVTLLASVLSICQLCQGQEEVAANGKRIPSFEQLEEMKEFLHKKFREYADEHMSQLTLRLGRATDLV